MGSADFVHRLEEDQGRRRPAPLPSFATDLPLDSATVDHWMRHFGVEPGAAPHQIAGLDKTPRPIHARPRPTQALGETR